MIVPDDDKTSAVDSGGGGGVIPLAQDTVHEKGDASHNCIRQRRGCNIQHRRGKDYLLKQAWVANHHVRTDQATHAVGEEEKWRFLWTTVKERG